jgi:hypothetical protein
VASSKAIEALTSRNGRTHADLCKRGKGSYQANRADPTRCDYLPHRGNFYTILIFSKSSWELYLPSNRDYRPLEVSLRLFRNGNVYQELFVFKGSRLLAKSFFGPHLLSFYSPQCGRPIAANCSRDHHFRSHLTQPVPNLAV